MKKLKESLPVLASAMGLYVALVSIAPKMSPEVTALVIVGTWVAAQLWPSQTASK